MEAIEKVIADQEEKGIIENVSDPNAPTTHLVHFLPFHPVLSPGKTTKCHIVYDASAKTNKNNKSLNDCLFRGPLLPTDLCGLLLRFLLFSIAIILDIEKAFLQIGLQDQA